MDYAAPLRSVEGTACLYYKNLATGEECAYKADEAVNAASVIKIAVMAEAFRQMEAGLLLPQERFTLRDSDRLPSCGVLKALHEGIEVTTLDLTALMITLSDNTATNMLLRRIGLERVNDTLETLGLEKTRVRRLLFLDQRLNGKMPFFLHAQGIRCAHKTGEDTRITHDCGIVLAKEPFIACFCSQGVDVAMFERVIQDTTREMAGL